MIKEESLHESHTKFINNIQVPIYHLDILETNMHCQNILKNTKSYSPLNSLQLIYLLEKYDLIFRMMNRIFIFLICNCRIL